MVQLSQETSLYRLDVSKKNALDLLLMMATCSNLLYIVLVFFPHVASQPTISPPRLIRRGSTWVQIDWEKLYCDGGFQINSYTVEYRLGSIYYGSFQAAGTVTVLNYTIHDLTPNTEYDFRVGTISGTSSRVVYSSTVSIFTRVAGMCTDKNV